LSSAFCLPRLFSHPPVFSLAVAGFLLPSPICFGAWLKPLVDFFICLDTSVRRRNGDLSRLLERARPDSFYRGFRFFVSFRLLICFLLPWPRFKNARFRMIGAPPGRRLEWSKSLFPPFGDGFYPLSNSFSLSSPRCPLKLPFLLVCGRPRGQPFWNSENLVVCATLNLLPHALSFGSAGFPLFLDRELEVSFLLAAIGIVCQRWFLTGKCLPLLFFTPGILFLTRALLTVFLPVPAKIVARPLGSVPSNLIPLLSDYLSSPLIIS